MVKSASHFRDYFLKTNLCFRSLIFFFFRFYLFVDGAVICGIVKEHKQL